MKTSNQVHRDATPKSAKIQNKSQNPAILPGISPLDFKRFVEQGRVLYIAVGTGLYPKNIKALRLLADLCTIPISELCRCAIMNHMLNVFEKLEWTSENDRDLDKRQWANNLCKKIKPGMPKKRHWDKDKGWIPTANPKAKKLAEELFLAEYLEMAMDRIEKMGVAK